MVSDSPKISIITVNYNNMEGLNKTIQSVISQSYEHIEYIVIDGGSSDGSKDIIAAQNEQIAYWVSEPDAGIYNAMNKGIKAATGEYLIFINSGDSLIDKEVIKDMVLLGLTDDLVYGNLVNEGSKEVWCPPSVLSFEIFYKGGLPHPSTFIKRTLFEKVGLYNEANSIVSDWEFFMVAVCKYSCSYRYIDRYVAQFMNDGISSDPLNMPKILEERSRAMKTHFPYIVSVLEENLALKAEMRKIKYFIKTRRFVKNLFGFKKKI